MLRAGYLFSTMRIPNHTGWVMYLVAIGAFLCGLDGRTRNGLRPLACDLYEHGCPTGWPEQPAHPGIMTSRKIRPPSSSTVQETL
jgi:hypothetical protein